MEVPMHSFFRAVARRVPILAVLAVAVVALPSLALAALAEETRQSLPLRHRYLKQRRRYG